MFQVLLCSVLSTVPQLPPRVEPPLSIEARGIVSVLQVSEYWFIAENRSLCDQMLFVGSEEFGLVPPVLLPPGMRVEWQYSRDTTQDLYIELLSLDVAGWRNSGAFLLAGLRAVDDSTAWLTGDEPTLSVWARSWGEVRELRPAGSILPDAVIAAGAPTVVDYSGDVDLMFEPMHVPVIVPGGGKPPSQPPKIEKVPLPPV